MNQPTVTVLMAVYDGERYLRQALNSILSQTLADFELLVIDDCSSDGTAHILRSYTDRRLRIHTQPQNRGLTRSLNDGIDHARGRFIARMDADDLCLPERLRDQLDYLQRHPSVAVCASRVTLIDALGEDAGVWPADVDNLSNAQIHHTLPRSNCLAHSSVMIRAAILKRYRYHEQQVHSQDWDLWLRLAQAGESFHKLARPLVKIRIHQGSVTAATNSRHGKLKVAEVQRRFLAGQARAGKLTGYTVRVFREYLKSESRTLKPRLRGGIGKLKQLAAELSFLRHISREIEHVRTRMKADRKVILVSYHSLSCGGAEQVLLDIAACLRPSYNLVMLASSSANRQWESRFQQSFDAVIRFDRVISVRSRRRALLALASKVRPSLLFFSNDPLIPHSLDALRSTLPDLRTVDILHSDRSVSRQLLASKLKWLDRRVVISRRLQSAMQQAYRDADLSEYASRLVPIYNGVDVGHFAPHGDPAAFRRRHHLVEPKVVTFLGRLDWDKDPLLFLELAQAYPTDDVAFVVAGGATLHTDCAAAVAKLAQRNPRVRLLGPVADVNELLNATDVLVLTSPWEGIPIAVAEAMACGVPVVAANVGALNEIVDHGVNGFLYPRNGDSVKSMISQLTRLLTDAELYAAFSKSARAKIAHTFSTQRFNESYQNLVADLLKDDR